MGVAVTADSVIEAVKNEKAGDDNSEKETQIADNSDVVGTGSPMPEDEPPDDWKNNNRTPKDKETVLKDKNKFKRTNFNVKGAKVYRSKDGVIPPKNHTILK